MNPLKNGWTIAASVKWSSSVPKFGQTLSDSAANSFARARASGLLSLSFDHFVSQLLRAVTEAMTGKKDF